jgi:hypothetical protein
VSQLLNHYAFHLVLLIISSLTGWNVLYYEWIPLYSMVCLSCYQLSRIILLIDRNSAIPVYLASIPYLLFLFLARDFRIGLSAIWYVSIMCITLQIATQSKSYSELTLLIQYTIFATAYSIVSWGCIYINCRTTSVANSSFFLDLPTTLPCKNGFNTCNCPDEMVFSPNLLACTRKGFVNLSNSRELVFIFGTSLASTTFFLLLRYFKDYAETLLERQKVASNLAVQNENMREELASTQRPEFQLDLDSPLTKVIMMIRAMEMNGGSDLPPDSREALDYVIYLLSSSQLYKPHLKQTMDSDVNKWLNTMLRNGKQLFPSNMEETQAQLPVRVIQSSNVQVMEVLQKVDEWSFDIFELERVTDGRPLFHLGMTLFLTLRYGSV